MIKRLQKILLFITKWNAPSGKGQRFIRGSQHGTTVVVSIALFAAGYYFKTGINPWLMAVIVLVLGLIALQLAKILMRLIQMGIKALPGYFFVSVFGAFTTLFLLKLWRFGWPDIFYYPFFLLMFILFGMLIGSLRELRNTKVKLKGIFIAMVLLGTFGIAISLYWLQHEGEVDKAVSIESNFVQLQLLNPGNPGKYSFDHYTYGSGKDEQRKAFGENAHWTTETVDAHLIIPEWKGNKDKWRKKFWGFDSKSFPINGRIWIPDKNGALPIVMIVHGNHTMEEFSDTGYGYLGDLIASQGYLVVSVDENFINATWSGDFRGKEMPARAWLLLKHLQEFRKWNQDKDHLLFKRIDLENIVLAGHSRGGEAVVIAAEYNKLDYFPDNGNVEFDFNFGIKGIVSIAPTDKRYFRRIDLSNVSYLSLQGSYDSDESSFFGIRQMQRIQISGTNHFKSALYIHRANHGQFNTEWGSYDSGAPFKWLLNVKPLLTAEDQREIAKVYIGAFIHDVFNTPTYQELFKSAYSAKNWLPETLYFSQFINGSNREITTFEEDIDLQSGSFEGSRIITDGLSIWREDKTRFRDDDFRSTNAVVIGWDTLENPQYKIQFEKLIPTYSSSELLVSIAAGDYKELKLTDSTKQNDKSKVLPIDFTLVINYRNSGPDSIVLSSKKLLNPALNIHYAKTKSLSNNWGNSWEPIFENYYFPTHPRDSISAITFVFDQIPAGIIHIDQISIQNK